MRKMLFFVLAAMALLLMAPAQNAQAQSETPKVETIIRFGGLGFTSHNLQITTGVGLRF